MTGAPISAYCLSGVHHACRPDLEPEGCSCPCGRPLHPSAPVEEVLDDLESRLDQEAMAFSDYPPEGPGDDEVSLWELEHAGAFDYLAEGVA